VGVNILLGTRGSWPLFSAEKRRRYMVPENEGHKDDDWNAFVDYLKALEEALADNPVPPTHSAYYDNCHRNAKLNTSYDDGVEYEEDAEAEFSAAYVH
jgi:hypothetical protein